MSVAPSDLRELELKLEVQLGDLEKRLLKSDISMRNWIIGIVVALLVPIYVMNISILIMLYNAKF